MIPDQKGVGFSLLRVSVKRRRTKQQILDDTEEAKFKVEAIQGKLAQYEELQSKAKDYDKMVIEVRQAQEMRDSLIESGHLVRDADGGLSKVKLN